VNGLFTWTDSKLQKVKIISDKDLKIRPKNILKDKSGFYWIGDYTFGLYRFKYEGKDNENGVILRNTLSFQSLKPDSAFATAWIQDMFFDHNQNLWISSLYTGVYKLEINDKGVKKATLFSTKNGLSSNDVTQITEGKDHSMWFATRNGVDRLIMDKNGNERIIHYNEKNGVRRYVYQILPRDSITYINYEDGFFVVNNNIDEYSAKMPLNVVISNVYVMGKPDTAALISAENNIYKLPFNRNFIAFDFGAVRFKDNEGIDYQYILEGIDKKWSDYSSRRFVSYNSLPPGKYIFKVRAKIVNNYNEEPTTQYAFIIIPPFYRTIWFVVLVILLLSSISYFIYSYRIKNLIKLDKLRTKIALDLHDDVGSTLSSISIMSDILHSQIEDVPKAEDMVNKIGTNAHNMLDSMDDIIWMVNPSNDKFYNLDLRIREYAIPLLETKNITFSFNTPENLHTLALAMDIKRNIFLIAKEAVNNLVKYSNCSHVDITFSINHSILKLEITDNGKGFDTEQYTDRNGLRNMKQRAEQINGKLLITSEKGKGTSIVLTVKII
jgi:two-component sensor histidine kinase